ncbi:MAG TPA: hypothetical protein VMQ93_14405 [Novosphingobium sp.]|nr:hypothetical protein [Novosphingobium sp.]
MNTYGIAETLAIDLQARLADMEAIGALVAAAHLEASIEALRRQFGLPREASETD